MEITPAAMLEALGAPGNPPERSGQVRFEPRQGFPVDLAGHDDQGQRRRCRGGRQIGMRPQLGGKRDVRQVETVFPFFPQPRHMIGIMAPEPNPVAIAGQQHRQRRSPRTRAQYGNNRRGSAAHEVSAE